MRIFPFLCSILHGTLSDDSEALDLSTTNSPAEPLRSPSPDKNMMDSLSSRDPKKASAPCAGNSRSYGLVLTRRRKQIWSGHF